MYYVSGYNIWNDTSSSYRFLGQKISNGESHLVVQQKLTMRYQLRAYEVRLLWLIFYTLNKWIEDAHKKGSLRHNGQTIKIKEILCKAKVASILLGDQIGGYPHFLLLQGPHFLQFFFSSGVHISYNFIDSGCHISYNILESGYHISYNIW